MNRTRRRAALADARKASSADTAAQTKLATLAQELGLRGGMTRKQKRLALISSALATLGLAVGLVLFALRDNVVFF